MIFSLGLFYVEHDLLSRSNIIVWHCHAPFQVRFAIKNNELDLFSIGCTFLEIVLFTFVYFIYFVYGRLFYYYSIFIAQLFT